MHYLIRTLRHQSHFIHVGLVAGMALVLLMTGVGVAHAQQNTQTTDAATVTVGADRTLYANGDRVQDLSCVETRCVGTASGTPLVLSCESPTRCVGTLDGEEVQLSSQATNFVAQRIVQSRTTTQNCLNGAGEACRNRCTTTYVGLADGVPTPVDCYGTANDPIKKALDQLAQCIGQSDVRVETVREDAQQRILDLNTLKLGEAELKQLICVDRRAFTFDEDGRVAIESNQQGQRRVTIPARCQQIYENLVAVRDGRNAQATATAADAGVCAWRGAVTCYPTATLSQQMVNGAPTTLPQIGQEYKCVPKIPQGRAGQAQCGDGVGGFMCKVGRGVSGIFDGLGSSRFGQALGQIVGAISGRLVFSGGGDESDERDRQCRDGYTQTTENGRIVCRQDTSPASGRPQCALSTNVRDAVVGDTIIVRWRTLNAESVSISGIGDNLPGNGEQQVTIDQTTEYILTAQGANDNDTTCSALVFVGEGGSGPTGAHPPRLSCEPSIVRPDEETEIDWACIASADSSSGVNIDTGGSLADTLTVTPEHNTEYKISCTDEGKVIGTNTCTVMVGEPQYDITAHPTEASRGERVRIAWGSLFMDSCRVRGPRGFDYAQTQGVVVTEPFSSSRTVLPDNQIRAAIYTLECQTVFDETVTRDVRVDFTDE